MQDNTVDDPARLLYLPTPHAVHTAAAMGPPVLYEPAPHKLQPPAAVLPYPAEQLRAAMTTSSTDSTRDVVVADATHKHSVAWLSANAVIVVCGMKYVVFAARPVTAARVVALPPPPLRQPEFVEVAYKIELAGVDRLAL